MRIIEHPEGLTALNEYTIDEDTLRLDESIHSIPDTPGCLVRIGLDETAVHLSLDPVHTRHYLEQLQEDDKLVATRPSINARASWYQNVLRLFNRQRYRDDGRRRFVGVSPERFEQTLTECLNDGYERRPAMAPGKDHRIINRYVDDEKPVPDDQASPSTSRLSA